MKENIESIVRQVVMKYFQEQLSKEKRKEIFIFLEENDCIPPKTIWEVVSALSQKYSITICMAQSWVVPQHLEYKKCVVLKEENLEIIKKMVDDSELLFLPAASFSTLAKLALTIDDRIDLQILIQSQLDGRRIVVAKDSFIPKGTQRITIPHSIQQRLQSYMNILREDKVSIITLENAPNWIESYFENVTYGRPIVLAKHVEEVSKEGIKELLVPKNSLITPMGKEYAKNLGISLKQKE